MDSSLKNIEAIFLDLDGTIYLGGELIPGALEFLERCNEHGIKRFFLSNNSSRSVSQYLDKLHKFGIPAAREDVLLSTHDLIAWLNKNEVTETWLIGTKGMSEMLRDEGIVTDSENPEYVVLGYFAVLEKGNLACGCLSVVKSSCLSVFLKQLICFRVFY